MYKGRPIQTRTCNGISHEWRPKLFDIYKTSSKVVIRLLAALKHLNTANILKNPVRPWMVIPAQVAQSEPTAVVPVNFQWVERQIFESR